VGRDSSVGIATRYGAGRSGDRIPVGVRFSAPVQNRQGGPPSLLYNGYQVFAGVKRPGRGVDHPPQSSVEVKERVELHFYSPLWACVACYSVNCTFTFTTWHNKSEDCNNYQSTTFAICLYYTDGERADESDAILVFCSTR
jgi:hypothetical protein